MANDKPLPKKPTLKQQYEHEVKRVSKAIEKLMAQGFTFDENLVPEMPKRVTQNKLQTIKKITPKTLKKKATITPQETVQTTASKATKHSTTKPKNITAKPKEPSSTTVNKPKQYRPSQGAIILDNIRELIRTWAPLPNWSPYFAGVKENDKNILERILDGAITSEGENIVARRMAQHAVEIMELANSICYDSGGKTGRDQVQMDLQRFSAIIMGRSMTVDESKEITDAVETYGMSSADE